MKKFIKLLGIAALAASVTTPSFARWRFSDQVRLANETLASTKEKLSQQLQASKANGGFYIPIPYRQNDVFVFCKEGPNTQGQDYYWVPTDGIGGYTITNYTAYIWNSESWISTAYYLVVCPIGAGPGNWMGPGSGGQWKGNTDYTAPKENNGNSGGGMLK